MMSDNIFNMSVDFLKAMTSRGILNRKIEIPLKQLRVLSCFGNNKDIPSCEYLKNSSVEGKMIQGTTQYENAVLIAGVIAFALHVIGTMS